MQKTIASKTYRGGQVKLVTLNDAPASDLVCDTPDKVTEFYRANVETAPTFYPDKENFVVFLLNTRRKIIGWEIVSVGTLDSVLVHPREVFRAAVIANAHSVVISHNHPSGDPTPSEADIRITRELIRAGQLLKIEIVDHVIFGMEKRVSLRELGYFTY